MHTHTYTHTHTHIHMHMHMHMHLHMQMCMRMHIRMHIGMHIHICIHIHKNTHIYKHIHINAYWNYISDVVGAALETESQKHFSNFIKVQRQQYFGVSDLRCAAGLASTALEKANALNDQFVSVFTLEDVTSMPDLGPSTLPDVSEIEITEPGVCKILDGLKDNKASGLDNIPARVLQQCAAAITPILQCIFQKYIATGTLPQDWCEANVSPIYKKDDRSDPANYRTV